MYNMFQFTVIFSAVKIISKHSVLSFKYWIVLSTMFLSHNMSEGDALSSRIYMLADKVPPSVEIECFPYFFINTFKNCSATSIVLSKEIRISRITLSIGSIATQTYTYSLPALISVSSIMNSCILFRFCNIFFGSYF
jgi:hypothetical protein